MNNVFLISLRGIFQRLILTILVCFFNISASAQEINTSVLDSLYSSYNSSDNDSTSISLLVKLVEIMELNSINEFNNITIDNYLQLANTIAVDSILINQLAFDIDRTGVRFRNNGEYISALKFHNWAHDIANRINNKNQHSIIYNNIGVVYRRLDDYQTALSNHIIALQLAEETHNIKSQAIAINSIGNIQMMIGNLDESLDYFKQSLILEQKINNLLGIAINLNNIGNVYATKKDYPKALEYFKLSLDVNMEIHSQKGIAICYNDIGNIYETLEQYNRALSYYLDAFVINKSLNDLYSEAYSYLQVGELYTTLSQYDKALEYLLPGLNISKNIGAKAFTMEFYTALYIINRTQKNYEKAFDYLELSYQYQDSINNINVRKDIARMQLKFESERKENHITLLEQNAEIAELDINRQKSISLLILSAFILALGFVILLSYYLFSKNKTNKLLLERNRIIEKTKAELDNYSKQLLIAKQEAEQNSKTKGEFLANMSHEIRTPLNSVIGFAELLSESVTEPQQLNHLKVIKSSGRTLLTLINDILDLSKIEAGKFTIDYEKIHPELVIEDIIQIFSHRSYEKNIELKTNFSPELPETIFFSELRLRQILFNLVGNAIKFTHNGSIIIDIIADRSENYDDVNLLIVITDTGIGINEDEHQHIFEPFNQSATNSKTQGTGLGLTITKRLVEMMNGTINFVSQEGVGTKFSVYFPNIKVVDSISENKMPIISSTTTKNFINLLILQNMPYDCEAFNMSSIKNYENEIVTNIAEAKTQIANKNVVIIYGFSDEKTKQALNILSKTVTTRNLVFIVMCSTISKFDCKHNNVILINSSIPQKELTRTLVGIFNKIAFEEKSSYYFHEFIANRSNENFIGDISEVYNNYFKSASTTKMSSTILEFMAALNLIAINYGNDGLKSYCSELEIKINNFEIEEVDNLLNLFNTNFLLLNEQYNNND